VRKYYRLTEEGGTEVTSKVNQAEAFIERLQALLSLKPALK